MRRARNRQRLGQLEQLVHVVRPRRPRLLHQRAEHALVARQRSGVRRRRRGAGARGADLEHRHAHTSVTAGGQRLAQARAGPIVLEVEGDRMHAVLACEELDVVRGREHGLVAARHHAVEAQAAPRVERVHRHVAALRDQGHVPELLRSQRVAP